MEDVILSASHKTINDLFNAHRLTIPRTQRPYTWEEEHREYFWDDFLFHLNRKDSNNTDEEFFIGSFLLLLQKKSGEKGDTEIYDGQQRITTIFLLIFSIIHRARKIESCFENLTKVKIGEHEDFKNLIKSKNNISPVSEILKTLITPETTFEQTHEYFFTPYKKLDPVFKKMWLMEGSFDFKADALTKDCPYHQVEETLNFFQAKFDDEKNPNRKDLADDKDLQIAMYAFLYNLGKEIRLIKYVEMTITEAEEAGRLFEGLNSRGKQLNVGDLLKNYIFGYGDKEKHDLTEDEVEKKWEAIISNSTDSHDEVILGNESADMLRHFAQMLTKVGIGMNQAYRVLKNDFDRKKDINLFLKTLKEFSNIYYQLAVKSHIKHSDIIDLLGHDDEKNSINYDTYIALTYFKNVGLKNQISAICSMIMALKEDKMSISIFKNLITNLVSYTVINQRICKTPTNETDMKLKALTFNLYNASGNVENIINKFLNELKGLQVEGSKFKESFMALTYKTGIHNKNILYILLKIEMARCAADSDKHRFEMNNTDWTIEHWLAKKAINDDGETSPLIEILNKEEKDIDTIGNLLPLKKQKNSSLSNLDPFKKYETLMEELKTNNGNEHLNQFFGDYKDKFKTWGHEDMKDRSEMLMKEVFNNLFSFGDHRIN